MERRKSEPLTDVLLRFMRQAGLESPLNEYRLVQAWPEVAGKVAAAYTREVFIRNQTLVVRLSSPVVRSELLMRRRELASQLNACVKADVIKDIMFV